MSPVELTPFDGRVSTKNGELSIRNLPTDKVRIKLRLYIGLYDMIPS